MDQKGMRPPVSQVSVAWMTTLKPPWMGWVYGTLVQHKLTSVQIPGKKPGKILQAELCVKSEKQFARLPECLIDS
jgi:hypothetical protein